MAETPGRLPPLWPERDTSMDGIRRAEFWLGMAFIFLLTAVWVAMLAVSLSRPR